MKRAVYLPNFGGLADARLLAEWATAAERAGWDGFFIWDHIALDWPDPVVDTTVALTAIALATKSVRFGALVTPLPRRRPVKFAREVASLDQLSGGRLVVGVGIGVLEQEFAGLGEATAFAVRAVMLDEALEVVTRLWAGPEWDLAARVTHTGTHYHVGDLLFWPKTYQRPHPPIWVAGMWPNKPPFRRAARFDGVFPIPAQGDDNTQLAPEEISALCAYIKEHRAGNEPFDVVLAGATEPGGDLSSYRQAGITWWLESIHPMRPEYNWQPGPNWPLDAMRARIEAGP